MLIAIVPLVFAILGVVIYLASTQNAKLAELGRLTFVAAMIALMLELAKHVIKIG